METPQIYLPKSTHSHENVNSDSYAMTIELGSETLDQYTGKYEVGGTSFKMYTKKKLRCIFCLRTTRI